MGAWIEILEWASSRASCLVAPHDGCVDWNSFSIAFKGQTGQKSHPTMGAWIEIKPLVKTDGTLSSHPTMGAWIEICDVVDDV